MNRNEKWNSIWDTKYSNYKDHELLHVQAGFDELTYSQWVTLTHYFLNKINIINTDNVLEVGCGSGAFLSQLDSYNTISGTDYSNGAIEIIRSRLPFGDFRVSKANIIPFTKNSFDVVLSFSVFFYFSDFQYAKDVISEMLRVLKPGGLLFIGDISDLDKKDIAVELRNQSDVKREKHRVNKDKIDHLYYPISFFENIALENDLTLEVIYEDVPELAFYENASYRFSVLLKDQKYNSKHTL